MKQAHSMIQADNFGVKNRRIDKRLNRQDTCFLDKDQKEKENHQWMLLVKSSILTKTSPWSRRHVCYNSLHRGIGRKNYRQPPAIIMSVEQLWYNSYYIPVSNTDSQTKFQAINRISLSYRCTSQDPLPFGLS